MSNEEKIACYTPTQGRDSATRIPKWKYDCVRLAIFDVLAEAPQGEVQFKDLARLVQTRLTSTQLASLGSIGWHVTTVKLNMEVNGELGRVQNKAPQRLIRLD